MEDKNLAAVEVVDIQFRPGQKIYYFAPNGLTCKPGDHVIIDTARGPEYGICAGGNHKIPGRDVVSPLRNVIRMANEQDERIIEENRAKEARAHEVCLQKIEEQKLDMQLVSAECAFDGSKILFFFTADERVDFRELVKQLASIFHTRIELRQIGVRDKAKMVGGLGICGRPFCCASFLDDFQPVSIKMAKTQNLSLNPVKISGTCGRLMCCLKYEQDAYEDLLRTTPKVDSFVDTPQGRGTIIDADLLRQRVKVQLEEHPDTIVTFANDEIAIFRSGKPKKNDPPIPEDWAPISGNKPSHREEPAAPSFFDPVKFFDSIEEPAAPEIDAEEVTPADPQEKQKPFRRNRNRRRHRDGSRESAKEAAPQAEEAPAQKSANRHHRRRPNRHRKNKPSAAE